jgi:hypothetical protein
VTAGGDSEDLGKLDFVARVETFLSQLYDVDAFGQHSLEEVFEVALLATTVRAQIKMCVLQADTKLFAAHWRISDTTLIRTPGPVRAA